MNIVIQFYEHLFSVMIKILLLLRS